MPETLNPKFIKLTEENIIRNVSQEFLSEIDYRKLIDINFTFNILPLVCQKTIPFLLILIHSAPKNFEKREVIRSTWGRKNFKSQLVFSLGNPEDERVQHRILEEAQSFNDIIQGSFKDSYKNLTYKHVMSLKYAVYHCDTTKYILKTDDDVFVNIQYLFDFIDTKISRYGSEKLLMCNSWTGSTVRRSFRSRYRITFEEYSRKTFPSYCSGWFILYSPDVVYDLYLLAQKSRYFWIDDVFVTGILVENLELAHWNIKNLVVSKDRMEKINEGHCDAGDNNFLLGRPNINVQNVRDLWHCVDKWSDTKRINASRQIR
ncbi:hypothetical protein HHI36_018593 [Cryptolaemus montrouzieri]|uniref:Hexosyltransferase n=1 Tax=Cryptolaemus montrouzieri TaxID=559131 RepID=A0ABD2P0L5_9CUCU